MTGARTTEGPARSSGACVYAWRGVVGSRGGEGEEHIAETTHPVHVAVCDAAGELVAHAGDPDYATPLRSCLKPIQALALFSSGAFERFQVTSAELALACASHEGAPVHTDTVARFVERLGLRISDLMCGAHPPSDAEALRQLDGRPPTPFHNNCSGKHAAMLASALALGAPTEDYIQRRHPVQALIRESIATLVPGATPAFAVDGCSAPTPVMSVRQIAQLYARLAEPRNVPQLAAGLARTFDAMTEHPELVGGRGVIDTRLMRSIEGLAAKRGADGGYAIALRARGGSPALGIGIKVESGSDEARAPAVLAVLEALGAITPAAHFALKDLVRPARKNHRGLVIGHWEARIPLRSGENPGQMV